MGVTDITQNSFEDSGDFMFQSFEDICARCRSSIQGKDWVRKVGDDCYHLACFKGDVCSRQLATGDQFALYNNRLLCKAHYLQNLQDDSFEGERTRKRKSKRMRIAFSEDQIKVFQSYFNTDQNPDPQELDSIAEQAGVNRRVAQVWFQNARARSKKEYATITEFAVFYFVSRDSSSSEPSFGSV